MEGSVEDPEAAPDSWEVADLDASMSRLMLSSKKDTPSSVPSSLSPSASPSEPIPESDSAPSFSSISSLSDGGPEDIINSVDQFLREALQNPRERLSVLRMEQDVEKFIQDPTQQQMEFQQLPTSYLRLAAHRVALHYSLQSMVLLDNSLPDDSGSKIIVCKTSDSQLPLIRLADIPINLPTDNSSVIKVAIKQRPQKREQISGNINSHSLKTDSLKSMEERKEEYNKARVRIFDSSASNFSGAGGKSESEPRMQDGLQHGLLRISKMEEKLFNGGSDVNIGRSAIDPSAGSSRSSRIGTEKELSGRYRTNNRVAIFRDCDVERKDPDYDRSYDRYMQRFDPGFGFSGGPYTVQPMYTPALNYNTEFPQLGSAYSRRSPNPSENLPQPFSQHLPAPWAAPSTPAGIGYGHPETMMTTYGPNHVGAHSSSALYFHSHQYPCQHPGIPLLMHLREQVHQSFSQSHQPQLDANFGLARPR